MDSQQLLQRALQTLGTDVPTAQNLMRIAVQLAQEINTAKELTGRAKLDRVIQALRGLLAQPIVTERVPPAQLAALRSVVDDVIPETISLVVEASRGAFQLKKPSVGCVAHWGALLCRFAAAHGPAEIQGAAAQAAQMATQLEKISEKEPVAAVAIELIQREVTQSVVGAALQEKTTSSSEIPADSNAGVAASPNPDNEKAAPAHLVAEPTA